MPQSAVVRIPLHQINASARNPRRTLSRLDELAASIADHGLLQPLVLRPLADGHYEIVAGHRRFAAVQSLGWSDVPAVIREAAADEAYLLTLVENLQRVDLSAREEAAALEVLVREKGWTTRQVAEAVKRSASYVSRRLRVFEDATLAPLVLQGKLTVSAAEELLSLPPTRRRMLAEQAVENGWDRPRLRAAANKGPSRSKTPRSTNLARWVKELRAALRSATASYLNEADRRELRLLFHDLAMLAKAPAEPRAIVIPPLPEGRAARR